MKVAYMFREEVWCIICEHHQINDEEWRDVYAFYNVRYKEYSWYILIYNEVCILTIKWSWIWAVLTGSSRLVLVRLEGRLGLTTANMVGAEGEVWVCWLWVMMKGAFWIFDVNMGGAEGTSKCCLCSYLGLSRRQNIFIVCMGRSKEEVGDVNYVYLIGW